MKDIIIKALTSNLWFHVFAVIAITLMVISFIIPPTGVIDPSVLAASGEIFAFAALWTVVKAIDNGTKAKMNKGDISIEVDAKHQKNPEDER